MKKVFFILVMLLGAGCVYKSAPNEYPYYYHGCVEVCNNEGSNCRNVCGLHYYQPGGIGYYWDESKHKWIGPHGYWHDDQWHPNGHIPE